MSTSATAREAVSESRSYMRTNFIILGYFGAYSAKYLLMLEQNGVKVSKDLNDSEKVPFEHPFFQMLAAYVGELVFTIIYYLYLAFVMQNRMRSSEIRFTQFIYPALCDFVENLLFIFGLAKSLSSMSMMTKAIALPITAIFCRWSVLRIRKTFNWYQIAALMGILIGATWIMYATIDFESELTLTSDQTTGILLLGLSACFQAFEVCLENRIFLIEKDLTALGLQQAMAIWKIILIAILFFLCNFFPESLGSATGASMSKLAIAMKNLNEEKQLYTLGFGLMFF